jgi:hypothetical protein
MIAFPLSTGEVAALIRTTEPRLSELVRRGRIRPAPPVVMGRRHWHSEHAEQAARALGLLTVEVRRAIHQSRCPEPKP